MSVFGGTVRLPRYSYSILDTKSFIKVNMELTVPFSDQEPLIRKLCGARNAPLRLFSNPCFGIYYYWDEVWSVISALFPSIPFHMTLVPFWFPRNLSHRADTSNELGFVYQFNGSAMTSSYHIYSETVLKAFPGLAYFGPLRRDDVVVIYRNNLLPGSTNLSRRNLQDLALLIGIVALVKLYFRLSKAVTLAPLLRSWGQILGGLTIAVTKAFAKGYLVLFFTRHLVEVKPIRSESELLSRMERDGLLGISYHGAISSRLNSRLHMTSFERVLRLVADEGLRVAAVVRASDAAYFEQQQCNLVVVPLTIPQVQYGVYYRFESRDNNKSGQ